MVPLVKNKMENGLSKLFNFWGQTIHVTDQTVFTLEYFGLNDWEGEEKNKRPAHIKPEAIRYFLVVNDDQDDPKCKHSSMTCRACVKLTLDVDGIDAIIDTQILNTPQDLLVNLVNLDHRKKLDTGTL